MQTSTTIIHFVWSDPIPYERVPEFVSDITDFGIYQIYGTHPVHGSDVLLYIGRAMRGSFGWEVPRKEEPKLNNPKVEGVRVHLGRLADAATPPNDVWDRQIELAERLLIFAHKPPLNVRVGLGGLETALESVHICNWGVRADMFPEVSGLRWTSMSAATPKNIYRAGENNEKATLGNA